MRRPASVVAWAAAAACAILAGAAPAAAQDTAWTWPARRDTVPLTPVLGIGCHPLEGFVLDGPEDVARLRQNPRCAKAPIDVDLSNRTVVGVPAHVDCAGGSRFSAHRSESERTVYVVHTWLDGGSRAMCGGLYRWFALPRLPPGWQVRVQHRRVEQRLQ